MSKIRPLKPRDHDRRRKVIARVALVVAIVIFVVIVVILRTRFQADVDAYRGVF